MISLTLRMTFLVDDQNEWYDSNTLQYSRQREADVVLRERLRRGARADYIFQLGELTALVECVFVLESMQHRGHPPREPLHFPYAAQTRLGVAFEPGA